MTGAADKQIRVAPKKKEDWCWDIGDSTLSLRLTEEDAAKVRDFLCEISSDFLEFRSINGYYRLVKSWKDNEWKLWREGPIDASAGDGDTPCEWDESSKTWVPVLISRRRYPADGEAGA